MPVDFLDHFRIFMTNPLGNSQKIDAAHYRMTNEIMAEPMTGQLRQIRSNPRLLKACVKTLRLLGHVVAIEEDPIMRRKRLIWIPLMSLG